MTEFKTTVETFGPAPVDPRAEQFEVRTRDGITLATDVYLCQDTSPKPVILVRLPYDKSGRYTFMSQLAETINERGFVLVAQDVRGKFRSTGETMPCTSEMADGYDTLEWLSRQAWCDGNVGMFGDSYYGYTQWAAAASGHHALKAIAPGVTSAELSLQRKRLPGAVFPLIQSDYVSHVWVDNNIHEFDVDWSIRPLANVFDEAFAQIGTRSGAFDNVVNTWDDPTVAGANWPNHPFRGSRIPVLHQVAWFDNVSPLSMRDYVTISAIEDRTSLQFLTADSRDHENYHLRDVPISPELDHGEDDAALARLIPLYLAPALDFFDWTLRGLDRPVDLAQVRWHLGHDGWHQADTWPPPGAEELVLHLVGEGSATSAEGGALSEKADAGRASVQWTHDPNNMVPSMVGDSFAFLREYPDESRVHDRRDVLTFTSEARSTPLDLAGPIHLRVKVGSSGSAMQVHAKLLDVSPDGTAHMITRGQVTIDSPDPDVLSEVYLGHTGYRLRPGHRLRIHLASSDFPLFLWLPGTGENPWQATRTQANQQTLITGGTSPSNLTLTVLSN